MHDLTWYQAFPARLVLEVRRVEKLNRGFSLCRYGNVLLWDGQVADAPGVLRPEPLQVRVVYPEAYPATRPHVLILSPEINSREVGHAWHRWGDGEVCVVRPRHWQMSSTAAEVIEKTADWYFNYTAQKAGLISKMPDIGRAEIPAPPGEEQSL